MPDDAATMPLRSYSNIVGSRVTPWRKRVEELCEGLLGRCWLNADRAGDHVEIPHRSVDPVSSTTF
jgi:hypothetical protein